MQRQQQHQVLVLKSYCRPGHQRLKLKNKSMDDMTIKISCQGNQTVGIDELNDLQGNLKDLSEENYIKLRNSITQYGFSFPILMWIDSEGKKWIIDAHQRRRTLLKMREEGWTIPPLPADIIEASSKSEAKRKLLLLNSRYGKVDLQGYEEFIHEPGAEIDEASMEDFLAIPELEGWDEPAGNNKELTSGNTPSEIKEVKCPDCGREFPAKDHLVDKT